MVTVDFESSSSEVKQQCCDHNASSNNDKVDDANKPETNGLHDLFYEFSDAKITILLTIIIQKFLVIVMLDFNVLHIYPR